MIHPFAGVALALRQPDDFCTIHALERRLKLPSLVHNLSFGANLPMQR